MYLWFVEDDKAKAVIVAKTPIEAKHLFQKVDNTAEPACKQIGYAASNFMTSMIIIYSKK